jgi:hypothetical protein
MTQVASAIKSDTQSGTKQCEEWNRWSRWYFSSSWVDFYYYYISKYICNI